VDYDRRGDGPPLLLVPGGVGHGGMLDPLAGHLADRFDVVTVSSRVASAKQPGALGDQRPGDHAEDVLGLIDQLFDAPPTVFGFSSGAVTTLELLARRPDRVRLAVVHEPPLVNLLPDAARHRAALESVAYQTRDLFEAMQGDWHGGTAAQRVLRVDGGMAASEWTLQFLADILNAPVDRPKVMETTSLGAAYLAGLEAGVYPSPEDFAKSWRLDKRFMPKMKEEERARKYAGWKDAVARTTHK
jgi:pimeloyl-ACP methyl ester carboxylesterase